MDESAAAAIPEDGGENSENSTRHGDRTSEDDACPSIEDTADGVGVFCCQDCGEAFREEATYLEHRQQHLQSGVQKNATKQQTYECPDCGKSYCVIGHFLNHMRSHRQPVKSVFNDLEHLKKKSFQCESCGRNYSRASALDAHRRCHEEKLIKSKNKSPGDAVQTGEPITENKPSKNQTEHVPEKLFKCSCGKAFSALMRLKTHQRFSRNNQCSGEVKQKPKKSNSCSEFYCSECKKNFSGHIALYNHQRWHANHSDDSAKRFPCEECGKVFMTLTFYYRHQRMAHSEETPAKSFLHQVCQLQKKSFECKLCGLKFSRASALHSHQLHHTEEETEKEAQVHALQPQDQVPEMVVKEIQYFEASSEGQVESESLTPTNVVEGPHADENDDDMESYEPGDFNVQVISASESEDEPVQDLNPDLELLCESDQEVKDDGDAEVSNRPEMDLKIVQIDFEQADEQCALIAREAENNAAEERFDCPDCYRWFSNPSSLRVHRMWHGVHKRRQQTQGQSVELYTCDMCGHEASNFAAHCNHIQTHNDQNTSDNVLYETEGSDKKIFTCNECGKCFSRMSALVSHQMHHPKRKQFQCPDCMMSYLHAASLFNHMKTCAAQKKENISITKREYNPKKTLLGPKLYYCEHCGKGFWSLGAYSHHKQGQTPCADLRLRKGAAGSLHSVNGHSRSSVKVACPVCGRKFRHKGTMALHMRKHENGNHKCELCNRSFRLFSSLLRHQVVHSDQLLPPPIKSFQHQVEQLKKNTYSCPDCGKLFSRAKALQFHMKSHGYETGHAPSSPRSTATLEDLQCATCLAHFNNKASLRAHQKLCIKRDSETNKKPEHSSNDDDISNSDGMDASTQIRSEQLKAPIGVKKEIDSVELKLENHTGQYSIETTDNSKYKCNKCDRSFSVIGALNLHKRVHIESYKSVPKTKLSISVVLKKSKQEETSKGLFHCSECGRRFMSNSALGSHKRWHKVEKCSHSALKDDDFQSVSHKTEDGRFQCKKCGKQFFNHRVLQRHLMFNPQCQTKTKPEVNSDQSVEIDSLLEQFSCPECSQTFVDSSLLVAHYEKVHCESLGAAERQGDEALEPVRKQMDKNCSGNESMALTLKAKAHQCPLCSMTFAKARGLRAHKWQAHSKRTKGKNKIPLSTVVEPTASSSEIGKTQDISDVDDTAPAMSDGSVGRGRKHIDPDVSLVKFVSCVDSGKQCISADALLDHKKVCREVKQEPKVELQAPEATAETPLPLSRVLEHTIKYLFKCGKCGKAFQTEQQLDTHKTKAKSRPYSCALCCHGFWTENLLQQHLAWHDEVRCRLPNEVRYRLSAALTSKQQKQNFSTSDNTGKSFPSSALNRPSQSSHKCQHCGKTFLSPTALQKHKSGQCNNNDSYHCSVCPRTFSEIQDLIDHHQECISDYRSDTSAAVSSGDTHGLTCLECGTTFCQETDLHQHYIEHAHRV